MITLVFILSLYIDSLYEYLNITKLWYIINGPLRHLLFLSPQTEHFMYCTWKKKEERVED